MTPLDDIDNVAKECSEPNWDGYGAMPVSLYSVRHAKRLVEGLPLDAKPPSASAEPDGCITLDWHVSHEETVSLSVLPNGSLAWAGSSHGKKFIGTANEFDRLPSALLSLVRDLGKK